MRRLGLEAAVQLNREGLPATFSVNDHPRRVLQVLEQWTETGKWWDGEGPRAFVRVEAGGLFDLSRDENGAWRVEVAWD